MKLRVRVRVSVMKVGVRVRAGVRVRVAKGRVTRSYSFPVPNHIYSQAIFIPSGQDIAPLDA